MLREIPLRGCAPEPLIHYLKALGVMRLVAEQLDNNVRGAWRADGFLLETTKTEDELTEFFLNDYKPTPIVSPWNNSSGFYPKDKKQSGFIESLCNSSSERFDEFRKTVESAKEIVGQRTEAPKDDEKAGMLRQARCLFPESALAWLDAAFVLGTEKPDYLPLLGSGGNDGRFDFTVNLFEKWLTVLPNFNQNTKQQSISRNQLRATLFQTPIGLEKAAVGQFHPGGAGGANASQGVDGGALVNPWDFIFIIEGSLLFASATVRQLAAGARSRASFPFMANSSTIGYGTATAGEKIRAEMWLPLWSNSTSYAEIAHIFKEGRVQFNSGNRRARSGFDFARAVAELGVDRGIEAFQRYAFIERNGQANLAVPLGVFRVPKKESPLTSLVNEKNLNRWLDNFHRATSDAKKTPSRFVNAVKNVEEAIFKLCADGNENSLREVFIALGVAERELSKGEAFRSEAKKRGVNLPPLTRLSTDWAWKTRENSPEFEIAQALASINGNGNLGLFRSNLEPIDVEEIEIKENGKRKKIKKINDWTKNSPSATWNIGSLADNLANILHRRSIDARGNLFSHPQMQSKRFASLGAITNFLNPEYEHGETDDKKIEDYLFALILVNWDRANVIEALHKDEELWKLPRIYALLKLLFLPEGKLKRKDQEEITIRHEPSIVPLLRAGRIKDALEIAERRLKSSGVEPLAGSFYYPKENGARLAAALLIPIDQKAILKIADLVLPEPEKNN